MFIEVSDGISVNVESIESVESTATGCIINTNRGPYASVFPYRLFLQLLDREEVEEPKTVKLEQPAMNSLNSLGHHFAG